MILPHAGHTNLEKQSEPLRVLFQRYGYFDFNASQPEACPFHIGDANLLVNRDADPSIPRITLLHAGPYPVGADLEIRFEPGGNLLYESRKGGLLSFLQRRRIAYHALLPHLSFQGDGLEPILETKDGHAVIACKPRAESTDLIIGLDLVEEIIRYTQGDPSQAEVCSKKSYFGFEFERPNYLFQRNLLPDYDTVPWADRLGFLVVEIVAQMCPWPLVEPLPSGARGVVILTGDDDEAFLEKYDEQLNLMQDLPITYFLTTKTRHTSETLSKLPTNVQFGVHPDALEHPEEYDRLCTAQCAELRSLTGRSLRTLRNHGFLNQGFLGHLETWENNRILLDVNLPGVDGTALNGSYLPMRVRRPDGTWSDHYSLLTAFGDGMVFALNMSEKQAAKRIRQLAKRIEHNRPGVLVFNFHPQNIDATRKLHREVARLARRPGWLALGLDTYLDWLLTLETIRIELKRERFLLSSPRQVNGLVLRYWTSDGWKRKALPSWTGSVEVQLP